MSIENTTAVNTGAAPLESNLSVSEPYNVEFDIKVNAGGVDSPLDALLADVMTGCGRVDLHSIQMNFTPLTAGDSVQIGFSATGSTASIDHLSMLTDGYEFKASNYTIGKKVEVHLVPDNLYSRQIRPNSADLPMLRLVMKVSTGFRVLLIIRVNVRGFRRHYMTLN
jgi:hypothetical protein